MNQPDQLEKWLNPLYEPNPGVIWPSVAPVSIEFWRDLYLAHSTAAPFGELLLCAKQIKQNHTSVRKVASQLQSQIKRSLDEAQSNANSSCDSGGQEEVRLAQMTLESQST